MFSQLAGLPSVRVGPATVRKSCSTWSFQGPLQSFVTVRPGWRQSVFRGAEFDESWLYLFAEANPTSWLYVNLETQAGRAIDYANVEPGDEVFVSTQARFRPGRHLQLQLQQTRHELDREAGRLFRADLTEVRATWQFNLRSFVRLTLQEQDIARNVSVYVDPATDAITESLATQLLYSYKLNPQTVFFAGYSDSQLDDTLTGDLEMTGRTLFFKLSYAWTP